MNCILLLTHDIDKSIEWIKSQNISNIFLIDEREIAKENPHKFSRGFLDFDYSVQMVEYMRVKRLSYKSARPMVMLMDMRHQTATSQILIDASILFYDQSLTKRITFNVRYKIDFLVEEFEDNLLQNLLQISS